MEKSMIKITIYKNSDGKKAGVGEVAIKSQQDVILMIKAINEIKENLLKMIDKDKISIDKIVDEIIDDKNSCSYEEAIEKLKKTKIGDD